MIPFNKPVAVPKARQFVAEAMASSHHSGDGAFTRRCHSILSERIPGCKPLLTTSCTHALEMAAILLEIGPGDEVIIPSFTFVSTANAFAMRGAKIVFADIRADTLNLDEQTLERLITRNTKAIVVVHYAGVGCEMDEITRVAKKHGIAVVEDNAHGLFGSYRGRPLGSFGCLATQSFHETKNISCGEGGALIVNDLGLFERAEIIREKGTNRSRFFRGQVDKYSWVDLGSSYLPSDLLAALLCGNLEAADEIQADRRRVWEMYDRELSAWADANGIRRPIIPVHCEQPWHMYYLLMPSLDARTSFIEHLASWGAKAVFHYLPLHLSEFGIRYGGKPGDCPVTEDVSERLVRLPMFATMTTEDTQKIIYACREFVAT